MACPATDFPTRRVRALARSIELIIGAHALDRTDNLTALQHVITGITGDAELINFCGHCQTAYRTPEEAAACARACRERPDTATRRSSGG